MRRVCISMLAGLSAALLMALATGSASANAISYSEQHFRIMWASLTFSGSGGGFPITCPVTLEGSFHESTFAKVERALVAHITRASVGECDEGSATILEESLPWDVQYASFTGSLPRIATVRHYLVGAEFAVEPTFDVVCLAYSTAESPAAGDASREAGGDIISLTALRELAIPVRGLLCPESGIFTGSGEVFVQGSTERRVSMTLI